jgi:hypothetical protein
MQHSLPQCLKGNLINARLVGVAAELMEPLSNRENRCKAAAIAGRLALFTSYQTQKKSLDRQNRFPDPPLARLRRRAICSPGLFSAVHEVRCWPLADMPLFPPGVCYRVKSGHQKFVV